MILLFLFLLLKKDPPYGTVLLFADGHCSVLKLAVFEAVLVIDIEVACNCDGSALLGVVVGVLVAVVKDELYALRAAGCGIGDYGGEDILVAALVVVDGKLSLKLYMLSQIGVGIHHHV